MTNILTEDFIHFAEALSLLMLGNAITGIMKAIKKKEFNWNTLLEGVGNYICWLIGCCCTVAGFQIFGGDLGITIDDKAYTLLEAIELAKKAVYVYWGAKGVENFLEYSRTKKEVKPVDPFAVADFDIPNDEGPESDKG